MEFLFQLSASRIDLGEKLFVFGQEVVHVAGAGVRVVRILKVEVKIARIDGIDGDPPSLFVFQASFEAVFFIAPPGALALELFDADRLALVVALGAGRIGVFVVPNLGSGPAFGEKQQVRTDPGVGIKDAVGQAHDSV